MDTHVVDAPPAAATGAATGIGKGVGIGTAVCTFVTRQRGQVRQASEGGAVWAAAVLDARGFVAADVTPLSHLSRIEWQPVCEGELVVDEAPAALGGSGERTNSDVHARTIQRDRL